MTNPWSTALSSIKNAADEFWRQPPHTYLRVQNMTHWSKMSNESQLFLPDAQPLTNAERFLFQALPYLYEIGWQLPDSPTLSYRERYAASTQEIVRSYNLESGALKLGLTGGILEPETIECLAKLCTSALEEDLSYLPLDPIPAGFQEKARLRYIAALHQLDEFLHMDRCRNLTDLFRLPTDPLELEQDIRLILSRMITLVEFTSSELSLSVGIHAEDAELGPSIAEIIEEPIKRWILGNRSWLSEIYHYNLCFKPSKVIIVDPRIRHPRMPQQIVQYLRQMEPTPFDYCKGVDNHRSDCEEFSIIITRQGEYTASSALGHVTDTDSGSPVRTTIQNAGLSILEEKDCPGEELLRGLGTMIYDIMFPPKIRDLFVATEMRATQSRKRLRIRLAIEPDLLARIPWELVYRPDRGNFMSTDPTTLLTRGVSQAIYRSALAVTHDWKALVTVSSPNELPRLDIPAWEAIFIKNIPRERLIVCEPNRQAIREAVKQFRPQLFFFIGHGMYENQQGSLALVNPDTGGRVPIGDRDFADVFLGYQQDIRLVCLIACETATSDSIGAFRGIAPQIVQRGIPAVVAMQYPILVSSGQIFLETLCSDLMRIHQIDTAVQSARFALMEAKGKGCIDFMTPVIYLSIAEYSEL